MNLFRCRDLGRRPNKFIPVVFFTVFSNWFFYFIFQCWVDWKLSFVIFLFIFWVISISCPEIRVWLVDAGWLVLFFNYLFFNFTLQQPGPLLPPSSSHPSMLGYLWTLFCILFSYCFMWSYPNFMWEWGFMIFLFAFYKVITISWSKLQFQQASLSWLEFYFCTFFNWYFFFII